MKQRLNATQVKQTKPKDKPQKLTDGGGLYLEIKPNGGRFWRYRYKLLGKENTYAVGVYPEISLADARKEHEWARKLVRRGIHPAHHRQAEKQQQALAAENTFKVIAKAWIEDTSNKNGWSESYDQQVSRTNHWHSPTKSGQQHHHNRLANPYHRTSLAVRQSAPLAMAG